MQTRAIQTLLRIVKLGSFAKVADELGTTISTVSMQVKSLEDLLGLELFDRSHRPPKLTPMGRLVCERAAPILAAERELLALANDSNQLSGNFRIGFVATASVRLLPRFLKNVSKSSLNATFEIETALSEALEARVQAGILDAAVVTETEQNTHGLEYHLIRREPLKYAIPKSYVEMPIEHLRQKLPFLQFNPGSGIGKLIQHHMSKEFEKSSKPDILLESVEAIVACVNEGLGFTLLPEPDIRRYASADCHLVSMSGSGLSRNLSLAVSPQGLLEAPIRQLVNLFHRPGERL